MSVFTLKLLSARSLANDEVAEKFYNFLDSWEYPPDVFDRYEPIKIPWTNKSEFLNACRSAGEQYFGQVLTWRRKRISYHSDIMYIYGHNANYHRIALYGIKVLQGKPKLLNKLIRLADEMFEAFEMDYGFLCLEDEYYKRNIIRNYKHPDGSIEPTKPIGWNWPFCIPGLYWINYYGEKYLNQGFANRIMKSHPENVTKVGKGFRFQTNEDPNFFESPEAENAENQMRDALGEEWFFNREVERECRPLQVSLEHFSSPKKS